MISHRISFSLDHSTLQMMSYHSETTQHYNETMENLKIINETIVYLLKVFWGLKFDACLLNCFHY